MAKTGRPKLTAEERQRRAGERKSVGEQIKLAIKRYLSQHPQMTTAAVARVMLGVTPQHLDRITGGAVAPDEDILSRAAHFLDMNVVFRGQTFTPQSFKPPTSPIPEMPSRQLDLKFEEPVQLNGVEVKMRVIEKAVDYWQVEIRLLRDVNTATTRIAPLSENETTKIVG